MLARIQSCAVFGIDYDPTEPTSIQFFQTVQNRMHWAITGMTAAEIIHDRADCGKPHMGLTNWRGAKVRKQDVAIAKNYLNADELAALNNLVEQYLFFAEGQAMRRIPMHMRERVEKLDAFLTLNDRKILDHVGKISHQMAIGLAGSEYEKFSKQLLQDSDRTGGDFDRAIEALPVKPVGKRRPKNEGS